MGEVQNYAVCLAELRKFIKSPNVMMQRLELVVKSWASEWDQWKQKYLLDKKIITKQQTYVPRMRFLDATPRALRLEPKSRHAIQKPGRFFVNREEDSADEVALCYTTEQVLRATNLSLVATYRATVLPTFCFVKSTSVWTFVYRWQSSEASFIQLWWPKGLAERKRWYWSAGNC